MGFKKWAVAKIDKIREPSTNNQPTFRHMSVRDEPVEPEFLEELKKFNVSERDKK